MRIIAFAPNDWNGVWVNRQQLLSRLSARHTVVYSNGPWYSWDRVRPEWAAAPLLGGFAQEDGVWVDRAARVLIRNPRLAALDRLVVRTHARRLERRAAGAGSRILHVFHPAYAQYAALIAHDVLVYHPYDWFERMPGWTPAQEAGERELLAAADIVIATSEYLADRLARKWPRPVRVLHNGVDSDAYARAVHSGTPAPDDLAAIPRPRLGYVGSLQPHIDFELVRRLAQARPDWHFVFVGIGTQEAATHDMPALAACRRLSNVHFLGQRPRQAVPSYAVNMDVNLIPWALGAGWVDAGSPNKLQEYLAAGAPVVSADLQTVRAYSGVLRIARGPEEWAAAIASALAGDGPGSAGERRRVAAANSWDARVGRLEGWLRTLTAEAA